MSHTQHGSLGEAWEGAQKVPLLYGYTAESWFFVAARIDGTDRLFIVPEEERSAIEERYNTVIEPNKILHMRQILDGKNDLEAGPDFAKMVHKMIHRWGRDMFRAREVDGCNFGCFINENPESAKRRKMGDYAIMWNDPKDLSCNGKTTMLETVRQAYQRGKTISFFLRGLSFTYDANNPLVMYHENIHSGIALGDRYSGVYGAVYNQALYGFYQRDTGLPHGTWTRDETVSGNPNDGNARHREAVYENGKLVSGSLADGLSIGEHRFEAPAHDPMRRPT